MARFKVVLTVINEDSCSPCVVGPRFRRGGLMPMEDIYEQRNGYFFDPDSERDKAERCAATFQKYIQDAETKKGKNK